MKLPCRHILSVRSVLGLDLYDESLCDKRWTSSYFQESQRIFLSHQPELDLEPHTDVVQLPPKKRSMSHVMLISRGGIMGKKGARKVLEG